MLRAQPGCTLFPYTTLFRSGSAVLGPLDRDLQAALVRGLGEHRHARLAGQRDAELDLGPGRVGEPLDRLGELRPDLHDQDRKSTRLNSSHSSISYAVFCLKK